MRPNLFMKHALTINASPLPPKCYTRTRTLLLCTCFKKGIPSATTHSGSSGQQARRKKSGDDIRSLRNHAYTDKRSADGAQDWGHAGPLCSVRILQICKKINATGPCPSASKLVGSELLWGCPCAVLYWTFTLGIGYFPSILRAYT
jgi:hypothetical protein